MIGMSAILSIRQRLDAGDSVAQVARDEGVSEPTVRKYRDMDDFSPSLRARKERASKLDPYKPVIDSWLLQDRRRRAEQRHTAKRIHDRLVAECGFDGGCTIVQQYVRARRAELRRAKDELLHLGWAPAEAQVDFGVCDFGVLGVVREVHYLVVTFPFSDVPLAQCLWGENPECVCEGLEAVFGLCGGVPTRLVFDNATGVGRRVGEAISTADAFGRFAAHYGFELTFRNPRSGNEKGAAENAVGAVRRNVFVPMPRIDNLRAHNRRLLDACMGRADKDHYLKGEPERRPFEEDCASMLELPAKPFRVAKVDSAKADKYGDVRLEGEHRYPLGPEHACERVGMELGAFSVAFFTAKGEPIAKFDRAYGDAPTRARDPLSQLAPLCRKPGAWRNSEVRATMPSGLVSALDAMGKSDRQASLRALRGVSADCGYEATVRAMEALAGEPGGMSEADVALAASCIANGQGAIAYDDGPSLSPYDAVFGRGA